MSNNQNLYSSSPNNHRNPYQQGPQFQYNQQGDPNLKNNMNPQNAPPQQFNPQGGIYQSQQFQILKPANNLPAPQLGQFYGQPQMNQQIQGCQPQNTIPQFQLPGGFQCPNLQQFAPQGNPGQFYLNFTMQFQQQSKLSIIDTTKKDEYIKKLIFELQSVKEELEEIEGQVSTLRSELTSKQTRLRIEQEESDDKDQKIKQIEDEFQSAKDKWKKDRDQQIQKQSQALRAQHQQEIEDLETEIKQLKQQIQVFQNKDAQQTELQNQIQELQEKLKKEQRTNRDMQYKLNNDGKQEDDQTNKNIIEIQEELFQAKLEIDKKHKHFTDEFEKNRDFQQKINSLVIQLSQRDESLEISLKHQNKINKELNDLKISLQEKEEDYKQLQVQIQNLKQENDNLIQQISNSKDKESQQLIIEIKQLKQQIQVFQNKDAQQTELQNQIQELQEKLKKEQRTNRDLQYKLNNDGKQEDDQTNKNIIELQEQLFQAKLEIDKKHKHFTDEFEKNRDSQQKINSLVIQLSQRDESLEISLKHQNKINKELNDLKISLQEKEEDQKQLQVQIQNLKQENYNLIQQISNSKDKESQQLIIEIKQLKQQIQVFQNKDAQQTELQNQIQELQEKLKKEQRTNSDLQYKLNNDGKQEDDQTNKNIIELQEQLFQAKLEIDKKHKHFTDEFEKNRDSQQKINSLVIQLSQRDESLEISLKHQNKINKELHDLKISLQEKEEDYKQLQVQIQNLKQENDNLIQQISNSKDKESQQLIIEIKQLKQQIQVFQNKDAQQTELQNQIQELQEKLKKEQRTNSDLQYKLNNDGKQEDDQTNKNIIELQEQLFQAKLEIDKKHKHFTDEFEKNRDSQQKINSLVIQLSQRDESLEISLKHQNKINKELNDLKISLQEKEEDQKQLQVQIQNLKQENYNLIQQISNSKDKESQQLIIEIKQLKQQIQVFQNKDAQQTELQNQIQELQEKLKKEQRTNRDLQFKLNNDGKQEDDQTNKNIIELQEQLFQAKLEIDKKHKHFTDEFEKNRDSQQKINSLVIQLSQRDESLEISLKHQNKINKELHDLKISLQEKEEDYKQLQVQIQNLKQENDNLIQQISNSKDKESQQLIIEMQKARLLIKEEQRRIIEKRYEEEQKILQKAQQDKQQRDLQKTAEERRKLGQLMKNKAIGSMGEIEVCFVVDVTESMEPFKKQTEECIIGSVDAIKKETGRNARCSTVAYQDINQWKKNNNQYLQHDFVEDPKKILDFLRKTKCAGGDDYCEDVKGGLHQMIRKLSWKTKFRVAVLICDAPGHGENINMRCGDNLPNDDITDTINKLIDLEIVFIVIQFSKWTEKMIELMKNLYTAKGKSELFLTIDLQTIKVEEVWKSLTDILKEASAVATGVKNSASKVKGNYFFLKARRPNTKDGAMEALCKEKNFKNFDQKADMCVENDFQVFRVDLKEKAFEDNISSIQNINNADFQTFEEGKWKCIRTKEPFAFGMMKSVYLMKRKNDNQNHLYVIKMPLKGFYKTLTLDQAKRECRSHLICKNLMRKFMKTLREKHEQKNKPHNLYPEIYYSDFLILQENDRQFWIAERFFDGEFIKYNNNWGFIDDKLTPMNQLAQAFTQFTYYISNFQYMINDVQGVGVYFTDPAVNTSSGDYDDTDMGLDGQGIYMVSFEHKKHISREILEVMDILIE